MKQKLLSLKTGVWYNLSDRTDSEQIKEVIKQLQKEREPFRFNDDESKFMLLASDLFDLKDHPGYRVESRGRYEDLYFNGKLIAIR